MLSGLCLGCLLFYDICDFVGFVRISELRLLGLCVDWFILVGGLCFLFVLWSLLLLLLLFLLVDCCFVFNACLWWFEWCFVGLAYSLVEVVKFLAWWFAVADAYLDWCVVRASCFVYVMDVYAGVLWYVNFVCLLGLGDGCSFGFAFGLMMVLCLIVLFYFYLIGCLF